MARTVAPRRARKQRKSSTSRSSRWVEAVLTASPPGIASPEEALHELGTTGLRRDRHERGVHVVLRRPGGGGGRPRARRSRSHVRVRVLGAAAGGGLPQWNCGCGNCSAARDGTLAPATQASVAVAAEPGAWVLLNVSPDARVQLASWPEARPQGRRHSPVVAVVLTSGELDHCLGLFSLRERQPLAVYATEAVRDGICRLNVMARTLEPHVAWRLLPLGREVDVYGRRGEPTGLAVEARPVPGRVPRHLRDAVAPSEGDVVAIR